MSKAIYPVRNNTSTPLCGAWVTAWEQSTRGFKYPAWISNGIYIKGEEFFGKVLVLIYITVALFIASLFVGRLAQSIEPVAAQIYDSTPSITVLSPNGGETWETGKSYEVKWTASNIPTDMDVYFALSVSSSSVGRNIAFAEVPAGLRSYQFAIPKDAPSANDNIFSIQTCRPGGCLLPQNSYFAMDKSDAPFSIVAAVTPAVVSEQVKCVFSNAVGEQKCYTATDSTSPYHNQGCSIQAGQSACIVDLKGSAGDKITWKSSCGGYAYTTMDGVSEYANFSCSATPSITLLSPNGGETWTKGTIQTIKWQDNTPIPLCPAGAACLPSAPKYYDIQLIYYNYPCSENIPCPTPYIVPYMIAKKIQGSSYDWSVGKYQEVLGTGTGGIAPDGSYTIQICQTSSTTCDSSDSYFKITSQISANTPPQITSISAPKELQVGEISQFGFAAVDPDRDDLSWAVSWGETGISSAVACPLPPPTGEGKGRGYTTQHAWNTPGTYKVSVYVTDCHGGEDRDSFLVIVGGSNRRTIIWQKLAWTPIDVGESAPDDGTWYTFGDELRQDGVTDRHYKVVATSMNAMSDYEIKTVVRLRSGSEVALCGRMDDNGNGYCFVTHWGGSNATMIAHMSNNDQNPGHITQGEEFTVKPNTDYVMKLRFEGDTIKGRIYPLSSGWVLGEEDWSVEASDTRYSSGKVGLYSYGSSPIYTYLAFGELKTPSEEPKPMPVPVLYDESIVHIERQVSLLRDDRLGAILTELKLLRSLVLEQQIEIRYLKALTQDLSIRSSQAEAAINNFITYGVDENTKKLGAGERAAVMYSYKSAFDKLPETEDELTDAIKIANGRWPGEESTKAESRATAEFKKIYRRDPNLQNPNDDAAVTVMAYGLRQRAENRNLKSEAQGIITFKNLYHRTPQSTEDWNIVQAITYSGAKR